MLNFFQIALTTKCNLSCEHCPMAGYRNTDVPKFILTNDRLIPWIEKNIKPYKWIIELTGGEPALYNGIDELVEWLNLNGYRGLIKTNGMLPIKESVSFRRIAAFHQLDNPPKYFDEILIIDKLQHLEKIEVCERNNWPYKVIGYNNENPFNESHKFNQCAFMDPHGHPTPCKASGVLWEEWPDHYALEYKSVSLGRPCGHCKAAIDCWKFMPDEWKTNV